MLLWNNQVLGSNVNLELLAQIIFFQRELPSAYIIIGFSFLSQGTMSYSLFTLCRALLDTSLIAEWATKKKSV